MKQDEASGIKAADQKFLSVIRDELSGESLNFLESQEAIDSATADRILERLTLVATDGAEMTSHDFAYNTRISGMRRVVESLRK